MAESTSPPLAGPTDDGTDADAWRLPRGLAATAVAIVAVLVGLGWSLHWWGPLNPRLTWQPTATSVTPGVAFVDVVVDNSSRSPVTIDAVRIEGIPGGPTSTVATAGLVPTTGAGTGWTRDDPARQDLPTVLEAGTTGALVIRVERPTCEPGDVALTAPSTIVVELRSEWGRTYEESVALPTGVPAEACPPTLPPETWSPPDPAAAEAAIGDAFGIAYDADLAPDLRLSRIDLPAGLEAAIGGVPDDVDLGGLRAVVTEVSFDRPDHAAVAYRLEGPVLLTRTGEAVLVDGTWKVTRSTVCADLGLVPVTCPPLPR